MESHEHIVPEDRARHLALVAGVTIGGMADRLVQLTYPTSMDSRILEILEGEELLAHWRDVRRGEEWNVLQFITPAEETERITDRFEQELAAEKGFRMVLLPIEAVLPRPVPEKPKQTDGSSYLKTRLHRVSREELHADAVDAASLTRVFVALTSLATLVAAVGLRRNDIAVIIGAMVIAPLLGPNVALALGTTLSDIALIRKALKTNLAGVGIALVLSVAIGFFLTIDPTVSMIESRTHLGYDDLVLALAAGAAGTFAFTSGASGAVIGVMVAVALLPPLATFGMLIGAGYLEPALGAALVTAANVICINLAGVVTFLAQGVRPRTWWKKEQAARSAREASIIWFVLLVVLVAIVYVSERAVQP